VIINWVLFHINTAMIEFYKTH